MLKITATDAKARTGKFSVNGRTIETPFFMPVATRATVKHISPDDLKATDTNAIISNAMILNFEPGTDKVVKAGGLHKFMNFDEVLFTDSGGFQMQSESLFLGINDEKVRFRNPFNNQKTFLSPEDVMEIEIKLNSDVAMALDQMPHVKNSYEEWAEATKRTHLWAERCKKQHDLLKKEHGSRQYLFGIAQGGLDKSLREKSSEFINSLDFDGLAVGGLGLGESKEDSYRIVDISIPFFDEEKPRYLMGIGDPVDILEAVSHGIDCFDSKLPTQNARHGWIFTKNGILDIGKASYENDFNPLDKNCRCFVCKSFTRAYLRHLFKLNEYTVHRYLSYHNIHFMQQLMKDIRKAVEDNGFKYFKKEFLDSYLMGNKGNKL